MRNHKVSRGVLAALALTVLVTGAALAQTSAQFDLHWAILSGGGGVRQSAGALLQDASGQTAPGLSASANYQVAAGFFGPGAEGGADAGPNKLLLPFIAR